MNEAQKRDARIGRWFNEYGGRLLRFVRSRIRDWEEAEDLTQEVWYQLSRQRDLDEIGQIGAWLFTAAGNRIINYYKKKRNVPFSALEAPEGEADNDGDGAENGLFFNQWIEGYLPDEVLESAAFWEKLQQALDGLPAEQREVFIANELEDVPFRELSEQSGVSINTLLARKRYAVLHLRRAFADWL